MTAEVPNLAVSCDILKEIWKWKGEGCSQEDIIIKLRIKTVPAGYEYHTWCALYSHIDTYIEVHDSHMLYYRTKVDLCLLS